MPRMELPKANNTNIERLLMNNVAKQWFTNARAVMDRIEQTQTGNIHRAAEESFRQGGAGVHAGVCDVRVDDRVHDCRDSGRARREVVYSSVA